MYLETKTKKTIFTKKNKLNLLSIVVCCLRLNGFSIGGTYSFSRLSFFRFNDTSVFLSNLT
jgi:hypothetical protein